MLPHGLLPTPGDTEQAALRSSDFHCSLIAEGGQNAELDSWSSALSCPSGCLMSRWCLMSQSPSKGHLPRVQGYLQAGTTQCPKPVPNQLHFRLDISTHSTRLQPSSQLDLGTSPSLKHTGNCPGPSPNLRPTAAAAQSESSTLPQASVLFPALPHSNLHPSPA